MFNDSKYSYKLYKCENVQSLLAEATLILEQLSQNELQPLNIKNYPYDVYLTMEELGLEHDLLEQLIADYIIQILKSCEIFLDYVYNLNLNNNTAILCELRELAHKNLGVVKNLRIRSAEVLLTNIMTFDDLDLLQANIEGLIVYSILFQPEESFNALKLLQAKQNF